MNDTVEAVDVGPGAVTYVESNDPIALGFTSTKPQGLAASSIEAEKAVAEVKAAIYLAKSFPRDQVRAFQNVITACQRPALALQSRYVYARGGTEITGPTIRLLETVAQNWQNIKWGWKELERGRDYSLCRAYAWDMENNVQREADFNVPHYRDTKYGRKPLKDDRDIYEMCANMAARRMRSCLQNVIPADVLDQALRECDRTLDDANVITKESIKALLKGFDDYKVTRAMIEKRIQRSIESITAPQFNSLRQVYAGLKDGMGDVSDYFPPEEKPEKDAPKKGSDGVKETLKSKEKKDDGAQQPDSGGAPPTTD
ncbi:MAG: hypothetical protein KDA17_05855 [Candidatus Saccharibacteria bacterium]|nr:hypothetical protein [Candidatus Saccharibacteria bacterium]